MLTGSKVRFYIALACCIWLLLSAKLTAAPVKTESTTRPEHPAMVLRIAAAADLRDALTAISQQFQQQHKGLALELVFGSSGKLSQQIQHGAPFDLYFAADRIYADYLWQQGFAEHKPLVLGKGHLVLVTRAGLVQAGELADLQSAAFAHIAIAEPQHAPYGDRAKQALQNSGLWQALSHKIVYGDNVAKTLQLVQSGAADAALVALSLLQQPNQPQPFPVINPQLHQSLLAAFVVVKNPTRPVALAKRAAQFDAFVQSRETGRLLQLYGFAAP